MIDKITNIIEKLIEKGSNIEREKDYLIKNSLNILKNDKYEEFVINLNQFIESNINKETGIKNISVGIKVGSAKLIINKGNFEPKNSVFDIASITKLFTLKLCYEFRELGILDFNIKIKDIDNSYINLGNYKIIDILKMHGLIETAGKLSETKNYNELIERLKTVEVKNYDKYVYTDIGFNILAFLLEKIYYDNFNEHLTFDKLCMKYIFKPYNLINTGFNLQGKIILGNDCGNLPSDKKAKILGGVSGAAGIYTNVCDLLQVGELLINKKFFKEDFINEILDYYFWDTVERKRSYSGIYIHTHNQDKSYAPIYFSNETIAHQGYTGGVVAFDLKNKISQVILVDALDKENKKTDNYFYYFHQIQNRISLDSLVIYIVNALKEQM